MDAKDVLRDLIEESPVWSQNKLGAKLGFTPQAMNHRMRAVDLKAGFLADALSALGYELVAVPVGSRLPNGSRTIGGEGR